MEDSKPIGMPLANHFKFTNIQCPSTHGEKIEMKKIPNATTIG